MSKPRRDANYFIENVFNELGEQAKDVGADDLVIRGGEFAGNRLAEFIQAWEAANLDGALTWAMVEEVSRFYVLRLNRPGEAIPDDPYLLERCRLFGPTGDLDIRRERDRFLWRFIGDSLESWPALEEFEFQDFWRGREPKPVFRAVEREYMQWRPEDGRASNQWRGETSLAGKDTRLKQIHYLDSGRIAFVRYVTFEEESHDYSKR